MPSISFFIGIQFSERMGNLTSHLFIAIDISINLHLNLLLDPKPYVVMLGIPKLDSHSVISVAM